MLYVIVFHICILYFSLNLFFSVYLRCLDFVCLLCEQLCDCCGICIAHSDGSVISECMSVCNGTVPLMKRAIIIDSIPT